MTHPEEHLRSWTPGPWTATPFNAHANDTFPKAVAIWVPDGGHERNKASAALIALAPEMADAILSHAASHYRSVREWNEESPRGCTFCKLAAGLEAI